MANYHELACVMGTYPALAIFKKFKTAQIRNLLFLQAQIENLSHQYGAIIEDDRLSHDETRRNLEKYVLEMQNAKNDPIRGKQWRKHLELRALIKEYNETLLQVQSIFRLPPVNHVNLIGLRDWLKHPKAGDLFLDGFEADIWREEHDLTSLVENEENKDLISKWIDRQIPWYYHRIGYRFKSHKLPISDPTLRKGPTETHLDYFPDSSTFIRPISAIFACILPNLSIFALYYITSPVARLGVITLLTSVFSLIVAIFANERTSNCFAATATFAAVLVVFVGSTSDNSCACVAK